MTGRRFALFAAAVWILCSIPLFMGRILPFADYPGHLARYEILARAGEPFFAAFWRPAWAPLPNLGVDLLVVGLGRLMPTIIAGRIAVVLLVGLWGFGFAFLHRQWRGAWSAWGLVGFPLVYSFPLQMGFLNYVLGVGLLMVGLGAHLRLRAGSAGRYVAWMVPLAFLTAISHFFAFGQLLLAILALELLLRRTGEREGMSVGGLLGRLAALAVLPAVYLKLGPTGTEAGWVTYSTAVAKVRMIYLMLAQGSPFLDAFVFFGFAGALAWAWRSGWRPARAGIGVALVFFGAYLASPEGVITHHLDSRQPVVVLLLFLSLSAGSPGRGAGVAIAAVLGAHVVGEGVSIRTRAAGLDRISAALARVPAGSILAFAQGDEGGNWAFRNWNPPLMQAGALGVLDHRLYPTMIFAIRNQQPLALRAESAPASLVPVYDEPDFPARGIADLRAARARAGMPWRARPLAVLFGAGAGGAKPGPGARLLAAERRWGLYLLEEPKP